MTLVSGIGRATAKITGLFGGTVCLFLDDTLSFALPLPTLFNNMQKGEKVCCVDNAIPVMESDLHQCF